MTTNVAASAGAPDSDRLEDELAYQDHILDGVSRTFALTIPTLPPALCRVVGNAYLLCRIADTIEDDPGLPLNAKHDFAQRFVAIVGGRAEPEPFALGLTPLLSDVISVDEKDLVANTDQVIRVTRSFNDVQRAALERCVRIMSQGMMIYQNSESLDGLEDQPAMDRYCYFVAGVVGDMLTSLFCDHNPAIARSEPRLRRLGISFGQGLQMTNILKDIWDDRRRGACWLPASVFARHGIPLRDIDSARGSEAYARAMLELVAIARGHLENALEYTLLMPRSEAGIRRFCLWALGMAVMNLRLIAANPHFADGREVKITRRTVKTTVALTSLAARSNSSLRALFRLAAAPLPSVDAHRVLDDLHDSLTALPEGLAS